MLCQYVNQNTTIAIGNGCPGVASELSIKLALKGLCYKQAVFQKFNVASPAVRHNPTLYIKQPPLSLSHDGSPQYPCTLWLPWQPAVLLASVSFNSLCISLLQVHYNNLSEQTLQMFQACCVSM